MRVQRKPIVYEAYQFENTNERIEFLIEWFQKQGYPDTKYWKHKKHANIKLPERITFRKEDTENGYAEGSHIDVGQWVIKKGDVLVVISDKQFQEEYTIL